MPKKSVQDPVHHQTKLLKLMEQKEVVSEPHQVSSVESTRFFLFLDSNFHSLQYTSKHGRANAFKFHANFNYSARDSQIKEKACLL